MNKEEFRKNQIQKLEDAEIAFDDLLIIYQKLFQTPEFIAAKKIGLTMSRGFEIPTGPIIYQAQKMNKQVFIPKVLPDRQMAFLPYESDNLELSNFGILEPKSSSEIIDDHLDLIIVPGIAISQENKTRVGFGGGYYDRFLKYFSGNTIFLATTKMNYSKFPFKSDNFDVPIQKIITP